MGKNTFNQDLRRRQLDRTFTTPIKLREIPGFKRGYIHEIRKALGMTTTQLAKWLGIRQPSVVNLENSERDGSVSLNTLRKAADVLDCELVYALVPRSSLESFLTRRALQVATDIVGRVGHSMSLEAQDTSPAEITEQINKIAGELVRNSDKRLWETPT